MHENKSIFCLLFFFFLPFQDSKGAQSLFAIRNLNTVLKEATTVAVVIIVLGCLMHTWERAENQSSLLLSITLFLCYYCDVGSRYCRHNLRVRKGAQLFMAPCSLSCPTPSSSSQPMLCNRTVLVQGGYHSSLHFWRPEESVTSILLGKKSSVFKYIFVFSIFNLKCIVKHN